MEDTVLREIISGAEHKLRFTGIHCRPGMLLVDCVVRASELAEGEGTPAAEKGGDSAEDV